MRDIWQPMPTWTAGLESTHIREEETLRRKLAAVENRDVTTTNDQGPDLVQTRLTRRQSSKGTAQRTINVAEYPKVLQRNDP